MSDIIELSNRMVKFNLIFGPRILFKDTSSSSL